MPGLCQLWQHSTGTHSQDLGLGARRLVFERASESKASGGKEKEPPFTQALDGTVSLPSTFAH